MARITRNTQKIFAGDSNSNQVTVFGSIKSGTPVYSKDVSQIMNTRFEGGWSDAVEDDYAPYRQDRNAIDYVVTRQLGYLFQEGIPEWDSGTTYYKNSIVKYVDSGNLKFYKSIADNNISTLNDDTKWVLYLNVSNTGAINNPTFTGTVTIPTPETSDNSTKAASTSFVQSNMLTAVKLTGNQTISDTKTFSSSPIVPTPSAGDNSTKAATTAFVTNFAVGFPDYVNRVEKTSNTDLTAEFNGYLYVWGYEGYGSKTVTINGVSFKYTQHGGDGYSGAGLLLPIKNGDTYRVQSASNGTTIYLIPFRQ